MSSGKDGHLSEIETESGRGRHRLTAPSFLWNVRFKGLDLELLVGFLRGIAQVGAGQRVKPLKALVYIQYHCGHCNLSSNGNRCPLNRPLRNEV